MHAIGNSPYWNNTVIFISWDDWGGWYDHVAPQIINSYEYGFRVPLIVVSPYAKLPSLGYSDHQADDLSDCFDFTQPPTPFQTIPTALTSDYFLKRPHATFGS